MNNIKYKKEELESMTVGNSAVNVIKVNGIVRWRKPVTITLTSDAESFKFDRQTNSKIINTYAGYTMRYVAIPPYALLLGSYYFDIMDGETLISRTILSSPIPTLPFTDGEKITQNETFVFTPQTRTITFNNQPASVTVLAKRNNHTATTVNEYITVYDGDSIEITILSPSRLSNESQIGSPEPEIDDNDNYVYTISWVVRKDYDFDLTLAE